MTSYRLLVTAVLTAIATTSCNENSAVNTKTYPNTVASRYYLAPESTGSGANINGVDVSNGRMAYTESDLSSSNITLFRQYSSQGIVSSEMGGWQHSYNTALDAGGSPQSNWQGTKSPEYPDAITACESGWQKISPTAYNGQLQTATAVFKAGLCELYLGDKIVARLPIQGNDGSSTYPVHILTRTDGRRITFYQQQDGLWVTTTAEPYQLTSTATGWDVITPNGSRESYTLLGKLTSITNPRGQKTTLDYNTEGQLATVTSPFGQTLIFSYINGKLSEVKSDVGITTYVYDTEEKLSQVTLPDGSTQSYTYTTSGQLNSITDPSGTIIARYTYDDEGRVIQNEGAAGTQARSFSYNGAETNVTDVANNATTIYTHAIIRSLARLIRTTSNTGATSSTEYNANGYPIKTVDANGLITIITRNARDLPESTTTAANTAQARTILTEWHPQLRKPVKVVELDKITLYEYDADGRLTNTIKGSPTTITTQMQTPRTISRILRQSNDDEDNEVQETSTIYNDKGQPIETIAPNGAITTYDYDDDGNRMNTINALNHISRVLDFDAAGRALRTEDENGLITENHYDAGGRLTSSFTDGQLTTYDYDIAGRQIKVTYPDGSYSQTTYDAAGNIIATTDTSGSTISYTYDSNGNRLTETVIEVGGQVIQTNRSEYNAQNQLEKFIDTDGNVTTYSYDKVGNQISTIDAQGRLTTNEYDMQNRLIKTVDAAGSLTQYAYDLNGNRTKVTTPNGASTAYTYDNFGRLAEEVSPDRGVIAITYDSSNNIKTSTDANGNITTHDYDLLNRKVRTTWQDGSTATWEYDTCINGIGRLCTLTDNSGNTTYQYDKDGRITHKKQIIDGTTLSHSYSYTTDDKLQEATLPSGAVVGYAYTQDKLTEINLNRQPYMKNIRYNAQKNITSWQWEDGTSYTKTYDTNSRLKTFPLGDTTRTLNYDSVGNIIGWRDDNGATKAFRYDQLNRLNNYTATNETQTFQYDANDNRTTKTDNSDTTIYSIQPNSNRLTHVNNIVQPQDANGNLLNDGTHSYTYNAQNRLASVNGIINYLYNADNQRVQKKTQQSTTFYAWNNNRIIGEYIKSNQNDTTTTSETVYFGNTPIALIQNSKVYRIYADQIDTPRVITDASSKTIWVWDSKPFGETLPDEDPDKDSLSLRYNPRFPGQIYDDETGLHYNFHRDYNPRTGRYIQSDPIGLNGGMNTFEYAGGSPVNALDLLGYLPTYIGGKLNRAIDISLDLHNTTTDVTNTIEITRRFPKIKFTTYLYSRDKSAWDSQLKGKSKQLGLHIDPVNPQPSMLTQVSSFYGTAERGLPTSIHGPATTITLPNNVMSALKSKGVTFVRAAGPNGTPPVVGTFAGGNTIDSMLSKRDITHYFTHPNEALVTGSRQLAVLTELNQYAR